MTGQVIPFYASGDFVEQLAHALWSYDRFTGEISLYEHHSFSVLKNDYLAQAQYVAEELDRKPAA